MILLWLNLGEDELEQSCQKLSLSRTYNPYISTNTTGNCPEQMAYIFIEPINIVTKYKFFSKNIRDTKTLLDFFLLNCTVSEVFWQKVNKLHLLFLPNCALFLT